MLPGTTVRRVKEVSKDLKETYRNYFIRGTEKFISKFGFKKEDLGQIYILPEGEFILIGQVSDKILLMQKDGSEFYVDCSYFHKLKQKK